MAKPHTPNDQRSNVKNPNNPAHAADHRNRVDLGHDNTPPSQPRPSPQQTPSPHSNRK